MKTRIYAAPTVKGLMFSLFFHIICCGSPVAYVSDGDGVFTDDVRTGSPVVWQALNDYIADSCSILYRTQRIDNAMGTQGFVISQT